MVQDTFVDIRQLDVKGLQGVKGYVIYDGTKLVVRTPQNPNNEVVAPTGCANVKPGQWVYGAYQLLFNGLPSEEISGFYRDMLNEGRGLYDVLLHLFSRTDYKDYRFNNLMKSKEWVALLACLFNGTELDTPTDQKLGALRQLDNRSRDCMFKEALKSDAGRTLLNLGIDDTLINELWSVNGMAIPTCDCTNPEDPGSGVTREPLLFNDAGSYFYITEPGVTFLTFVIAGGGATGGCSGAEETRYNRQGMGGGEAGEVVVWRDVPVVEGQRVDIRVGTGGKTQARKYEYVGRPANGQPSTVSVGDNVRTASGGQTTLNELGGGNTPTGKFNPVAGEGGAGGQNSLASGGAGGRRGFVGDDWDTARGKDGEFPGGGGGGAGSDDDAEGFPGGDGASGCVWVFKNNEGYKTVADSKSPLTAGQNARKYR